MDLSDLADLAEASTDRFRLEAIPTYLVDAEADQFAAWRRGDRTLLTPETSPWLARIKASTAAGARWSRVRILDYPLTDYSAFELHSYQGHTAAGAAVYIADRAWSGELTDLHTDFWVFDGTVVRMVYDDAGHFLHPELVDDPAPFYGARAVALRHSIPLEAFLAEHEPRLIA